MKILRKFVVIGFWCFIGIRAMVLQTTDSNGIFSIPTRLMDDDDLLEEHGRFMLANMNPDINPCENFYEYACGNWQNDSMVPSIARNNTLMGAIGQKVNELILDFLKNKTVLDENSAENKMKQFFDSCIKSSQDLSQGYRETYNSITEPTLSEGETLDWMILNFYKEYGVTPLLPLTIDYKDSSAMYEIFISKHKPLFSSSYLNFTKISEDLKFEDKEAVEKELEELKSFEKKLIASVELTNTSKSQSLKEFMEYHNSSDVDWKRFFELAFNRTALDSWIINDNYMNFANIISFLNTSDTGVMFRYVKWYHILYFYYIWDLKENQNIEKHCRQISVKYFKSAIIPWLIDTTFDEERRTDALLLSKRVKDTFYSLIDSATWLDSETKSGAKSKLRAMDVTFGYTDDMRNPSEVNNKFKDVNLTRNYWVNVMNLEENQMRRLRELIGKTSSKQSDFIESHKVNAFYLVELNQAFVTIALPQLPLYHIKLPNSLKFGGIGNVIAHEMVHGFDSGHYKFDYNGQERNWWSPESLRNFKERFQCLESQYNKFIYEGVRLNGKRTSNDNIADNVGLKIAYQSYLRFLDENENLESGKDKPLPGVDFTNKQLFFLKFAQSWCDGKSTDELKKLFSSDEHSLHRFRVIGTLMNAPEFSAEFNCPLGTNMNPLKKCIIYGNE